MIQASDDALEQLAVAAMEKEGLTANRRMPRGSKPLGEAGTIHVGGGRYIDLVCDNELFFHNTADRWPEAVDLTLVAPSAMALAPVRLLRATQSPWTERRKARQRMAHRRTATS